MGGTKEEKDADNLDIDKATQYLLREHLPKIAVQIEKDYRELPMDELRISQRLHEFGINLRFLGLFRAALPQESHLRVGFSSNFQPTMT